jgi:hypothetical protein
MSWRFTHVGNEPPTQRNAVGLDQIRPPPEAFNHLAVEAAATKRSLTGEWQNQNRAKDYA